MIARRLASGIFFNLLALILVVVLPVAVLCRVLLGITPFRRLSYWTGEPILTLARKAASERQLGIRAVSMVRKTYFISDDFDIVLDRYCGRVEWVTLVLSALAFLVILITASRVHTFADGGILVSGRHRRFSRLEACCYWALGIRHFVWAYGADVRTRDVTIGLGQYNCCVDCTQIGKACICSSDAHQSNFRLFSLTGAVLLSMGDMTEYMPGSRVDMFYWPLSPNLINRETIVELASSVHSGRVFKIIHAPNHREFKGTKYLQDAVEVLRREGEHVELLLVERIPNAQAIELYRTADLVFDQCLIGYHGYFALEAMAMGKPVMCFIRKPSEYLLHPEECPIINTTVETLTNDLRRLINSREELARLGTLGERYVRRHYTQAAFASRLAILYRDLGVKI